MKERVERVAMAIYWAAYDQYLGNSYTHPKGFTMEVAWQRCSETQRVFCRHQARRAIKAGQEKGLEKNP